MCVTRRNERNDTKCWTSISRKQRKSIFRIVAFITARLTVRTAEGGGGEGMEKA
uniref:Uncharacterized protein n=1 Tax=Anguilla anguilla TaxID=7936 RepID=A0A0E9QAX2_ANGAN